MCEDGQKFLNNNEAALVREWMVCRSLFVASEDRPTYKSFFLFLFQLLSEDQGSTGVEVTVSSRLNDSTRQLQVM